MASAGSSDHSTTYIASASLAAIFIAIGVIGLVVWKKNYHSKETTVLDQKQILVHCRSSYPMIRFSRQHNVHLMDNARTATGL